MTLKTQFADLGLFDAKVPRYTSYPTAPHFSDAVNASHFANWIRAINPGSEVSLYVHVPFCKRLCWFCACRTQGTKTMSPVASYVEMLKQELALLRAHLPAGVTLSRLHWGGGTPTLLTPDMMEDLCTAIFDVAPMADDGEFSVEIDPNEIDSARFAALAKFGMNRASIGVQDFDPEIQNAIGRIQDFETTRDAIEMARSHGIQSVNADILFGLPFQDQTRMSESVQKLLSLNPDRVALYGYAHVPWMSKRQQLIPSDALPTPQERLALFETASDLFLADGFNAIGIDHFATPTDGLSIAQKSGKLRRNFQGYTDDQADVLIGVGASSISRFPQGFAQNAPPTSVHTKAIQSGQFSISRGHVFSQEDALNAALIESVMCNFGIDAKVITSKFDISSSALRARLERVNRQFDGLLEVSQNGMHIPTDVRPLTRMIARAFDAYSLNSAGHSSAI